MQFLAPPLAKVLELGESFAQGNKSGSEVAAAATEALAFIQEGTQLYRLLSPGILRSEVSSELLRQIELEQQAQLEGVQALQKAAGGEKVAGLSRMLLSSRQASERLLELFAKLQEAEIAEKVYSPFPVLDHFLKVGINHLNGKIDLFEVSSRVSTVAGLVGNLGQDVERFRGLYPGSNLGDACRPPLEEMQAGLGAVATYMSSSEKKHLEDGLKLLGASGAKLSESLQALDRHAEQERKFSSLRYLEELGRAAQAGEPWQTIAVGAVQQALGFYEKELAQARRSPLFFEVESSCNEASQVLASIDRQPVANVDWVKRWEPAFVKLDQAVQALRASLNEEAGRYAQAPHIAGLRELIGRMLSGDLTPEAFATGLKEQQERHAQLMEHLQAGTDPLSQELTQLVGSHSMAFVRMGLFLSDGDRDHLLQGWKLVSLTCGRIVSLTEQLKSQLGSGKGRGGPKMIVCFRCGKENAADQRRCGSCGTNLPQMSQEVTEYTEISAGAGGEEYTMPSNLAALEALAGEAEAGNISRDELTEGLDKMLKQCDKVRANFEKSVITMMGKDPTFDAYAQFFALRMGQFVQGIMQMRSFAEGGSLNHLYSGLAACRESGEELQGFQDVIGKALRANS